MTDVKVEVETKKCFHCGKNGYIIMLQEDYFRGIKAYDQGQLVQDAFPNMSIDQREQIISGTHPECWIALFGYNGKEDEDAYELRNPPPQNSI